MTTPTSSDDRLTAQMERRLLQCLAGSVGEDPEARRSVFAMQFVVGALLLLGLLALGLNAG